MAVRSFDGVDDRVDAAVGNCAGAGDGAVSLAFLVKVLAQDGAPFWLGSSGGAARLTSTPFGFNWFLSPNGSDYVSYASAPVGASWTLVGVTKAAGTAAPRGHRYVFDTAVWTHADAGGTLPAATNAGQAIHFGWHRNVNQYENMLLAAAGVWDGVVLSDVDFEGMTTALQAWLDLSPAGLWRFNQTSTSDPVLDLTGGGADETGITGTSVVTGDDPPGFDFAIGGELVSEPGRFASTTAAARFASTTAAARFASTTAGGDA